MREGCGSVVLMGWLVVGGFWGGGRIVRGEER